MSYTLFSEDAQFVVENIYQYAFENCGYHPKKGDSPLIPIENILRSGNPVVAIIDNNTDIMYLKEMFSNAKYTQGEIDLLMKSAGDFV